MDRGSRPGLALVALLFAACEPGTAEPGPPDAGDPTPDAPSAPDAAPVLGCYEPSREAEIEPRPATVPSCAIRNNLEHLSGRVLVLRERGQLTIQFPNKVSFRGSIEDELVSLDHVHSHALSEECTWRITETLSGDLDPESCLMRLGYEYRGETAGGACGEPCSAVASVYLELIPL